MLYAIRLEATTLDPVGGERKVLEDLRRSRSAEKRQVLHATILLDSAHGVSDNAVVVANGANCHTVTLCVRQFLQFGIDAALGELPAWQEH